MRSFGKKYVDFWGMVSPASETAATEVFGQQCRLRQLGRMGDAHRKHRRYGLVDPAGRQHVVAAQAFVRAQ